MFSHEEAHDLANNMSIKFIIIESDNQELITICKKKANCWQISPIMNQIEDLEATLTQWLTPGAEERQMEPADEVAFLCRNFRLPRHWVLSLPSSLHRKLLNNREALA